jgi:hypothetical protein
VPGDSAPESTSREPNHSTATTDEKMVKMAKKVRKERAKTDERAAMNAVSTAWPKRPVTSRSFVKACNVRIEPMCSLA